MAKMTVDSLGVIAFFRGKDVWVAPNKMRRILKDNGYDPSVVPNLDPVQRARAAATEFRTGRLTGCKPTRIEILSQTTDKIRFGVLWREEVTKGQKVRWEQHDIVEFDRNTGWSTPVTREGAAFVEAGKRWQSHLDYRWLRDKLVLPSLELMGGFSINRSSGMYFVHNDRAAELDPLERIVAECGKSELHILRIAQDPKGARAIAGAAQESLAERIEAIQKGLADWQRKTRGRTSTIEDMMKELNEIRSQAVVLSTGLQFSLDELDARMTEAEQDLRDAIDHALALGPAPAPRVVNPDAKPYTGMSMSLAAALVLQDAKVPLHYKEITKRAMEAGYFSSSGATPWETLNSQLCVAQLKNPDTCQVQRVGKGTWQLRPGVVVERPQAPQPEATETETEQPQAQGAQGSQGLQEEPSGLPPEPGEALSGAGKAEPEAEPEPEAKPAPEGKGKGKKTKAKEEPEPEAKEEPEQPQPKAERRVVVTTPGGVEIPDTEALENMAVKELNLLCRDLAGEGFAELKGWSKMGATAKVTAVLAIREAVAAHN